MNIFLKKIQLNKIIEINIGGVNDANGKSNP